MGILTVSDSVAQRRSSDASGPALQERCRQLGWEVVFSEVSADEESTLRARLLELCESGKMDLLLTTGGTGIGPRDVTPEATLQVASKTLPGLAERMRQLGSASNPRAALSRAVAGVRERTLIVNLPGSPRGALESLDSIAELLPHALEVLHGARHDGAVQQAKRTSGA